MKREKTVGMAITEDELRQLLEMMKRKESEIGKRLTVSNYLREYFLQPHLNGNSAPPQETEIEDLPIKTDESNRWDDIKF